MTFYIFYQIVNIIVIAISFYMAMRLYEHLEEYENRALELTLIGLILDSIGQFSISHCDTVEAAGVGLRMSISGRAIFGIGIITYITLVFKAKHRHIIIMAWALASIGAFFHGFMLGRESVYFANPEIVKYKGVSMLVGDRGPLYYLAVGAALILAVWTIILAAMKLRETASNNNHTEFRIAFTYLATSALFVLSVAAMETLLKGLPSFSSTTRVVGIFIFYRFAVKYTFENYDVMEYRTLVDDAGSGFVVLSEYLEVLYANEAAKQLLERVKAIRKQTTEDILKSVINKKEYKITVSGSTYKVTSNRNYVRGKHRGYSIMISDITDIVQLEKRAEQNSLVRTRLLSNMSHEMRTPLNAITQAAEVLENPNLEAKEITEYTDIIKKGAININDMLGNFLEMTSERNIVQDIASEPYNVCALMEEVNRSCTERIIGKAINYSISFAPDVPLNAIGDMAKISQVLTTIISNIMKYADAGSVNIRVQGNWTDVHEFEYEYLITDIVLSDANFDSAIEKVFTHEFDDDVDITTGYEISLYVVRKIVRDIGGRISLRSLKGRGNIYRFGLIQKVINKECLNGYNLGDKLEVICCGDNTDHIKDLLTTCGEYGISAMNINGITHLRKQSGTDNVHHILMYSYDKHEKKVHQSERAKGYTKVAVLKDGQIPVNYDPDVIYVYKPLSILTLRNILLHIEEKEKTGLSYDRFTAPGARVLVVDDNTINIELAIRMLEQYKMVVDTVGSGREALELIKSGREYDIIFMDYMMDGMDGVETTRRIRALGGIFTDVPVIAFSANNVLGARDKYIAGGMNDCIFKPATKADIENALRKYLPSELLLFEAGKPSFEIPNEPFPQIEDVDSATAAKYVGNNIKVFKDMLVSFANDIKGREKMIMDYLDAGDFRNFVIQTHAVKGIARTLGMLELSDRMARMEQAGKDEDIAYINANLSELLSYYRKFNKILMPFVEEKERKQRGVVIDSETGKVLVKIKEVLEDFEVAEAERLFYTIWPGDFDNERAELMRELKSALEAADYYESLDYVDKLIETYNGK